MRAILGYSNITTRLLFALSQAVLATRVWILEYWCCGLTAQVSRVFLEDNKELKPRYKESKDSGEAKTDVY